MEIFLHLLAILVLIATPIIVFMEKDKKKNVKTFFSFLNFVVLLSSFSNLLYYLTPSQNPMWVLAVFVPTLFVIFSIVNLLFVLKINQKQAN